MPDERSNASLGGKTCIDVAVILLFCFTDFLRVFAYFLSFICITFSSKNQRCDYGESMNLKWKLKSL